MTGKRAQATESRSNATAKCQGCKSTTACRSIPRVDAETEPAQRRVHLPGTSSNPDKTKGSGYRALAKPREALPHIPPRRAQEKIGFRRYPLHHSKHPGSSVLILTLQGGSCRLGRSRRRSGDVTGAGPLTTDHFRSSYGSTPVPVMTSGVGSTDPVNCS